MRGGAERVSRRSSVWGAALPDRAEGVADLKRRLNQREADRTPSSLVRGESQGTVAPL
ncbi:hypothetical protein AB0451_09010 [Streptomyces sp. NPDC052000]|uniref:hypothetical protein n=1 Tax=Streptomyces sp. NPDC052000 TaxID=3155676 RepID=UPI00344B4B01